MSAKRDDHLLLRAIPPVDEILDAPEIAAARVEHPRIPWTPFVRRAIDAFRQSPPPVEVKDRGTIKSIIISKLLSDLHALKEGGLRRVINGTGVILHTNLGRAVLAAGVQDAVRTALGSYVNLEIDLDTGQRGHRGETLDRLLQTACGSEAAMVVNNNAAAVYLVASSYSPPGKILVSRGELVEIGGSFRLPDILGRAGETVVEVGTTNRTYIRDYADVAGRGDVLLKAHRSNYDIQGFTHEASTADLVALARERGCFVVYDLGSGSFFDFASLGLEGEERVADVLSLGVDCVTMSGDKLLGGVQAGIIVGTSIFLDRLRKNPLRRAVRVDKVTIAALQCLMRIYLFGATPGTDIPVLRQAGAEGGALRKQARRVVDRLPESVRRRYGVGVDDDAAVMGGGSFATQDIPSVAITLGCASDDDASRLARRLRQLPVPVLSRIKGNEVRVNMRSVLPEDMDDLIESLSRLTDDSSHA